MTLPSTLTIKSKATVLLAKLPPWTIVLLLVLLAGARFLFLTADFPPGLSGSGVIYTDEGWWSRNAVAWVREGHWYIDDGYNPIANLPGLPLLQVLWFKAFGISLSAARSLTAVCTVAMSAVAYVIARRELSHRLAVVVPFMILSSYPVFVFSRLALLEMPMLLLVMLSLWLATSEQVALIKPPLRHSLPKTYKTNLFSHPLITTSASASFLTVAILTKTTALFALPVVLMSVFTQPTNLRRKGIQGLIWLSTFGAIYGLYYITFVQGHLSSVEYFTDYNLTSKIHKNLFSLFIGPFRTLKYGLTLFPLLLPCLFMTLVALSKLSYYRTSQLFRITTFWSLSVLVLFSASNYGAARYFLVLTIPIAFASALVVQSWSKKESRWTTPLLIAIVLSVVMSLTRITLYLTSPSFTFINMATEVEQHIRQHPQQPSTLIGPFSDSLALARPIKAINDTQGYRPLAYRLETFQPGYYISIGPVEEMGDDKEQLFKQRYDLQLINTFDVYENRTYNKPVFFYQLSPQNAE